MVAQNLEGSKQTDLQIAYLLRILWRENRGMSYLHARGQCCRHSSPLRMWLPVWVLPAESSVKLSVRGPISWWQAGVRNWNV